MSRIVIENVNESLKQKFRTSCTLNKTTMRDVIINMIIEYSDNTIESEIQKLKELRDKP